MAKHTVNGGHSKKSPGASKYLDEVAEDRKVKDAIIKYLKAGGATVHDSTDDSSTPLTGEINAANASGADYGFSVHFNAGGGTGVECFYHRSKKPGDWAYDMAVKISAAVAKLLGLRDRGAKKDTDSAPGSLGWITKTKMPALLLEVCFVDTQNDADAYNRVGPDAIGKCIAECLLGKATGPSTGVTKPASSGSTSSSSSASSASSGSASTGKTGTGFGGTYRCTVSKLNVRDKPSLSGKVVTHYSKGKTVALDDWYKIADGWVWGRYTGASSGKTRYVAVGKATGKPEPNDYLVKVK